jgi:cell division protein FtsI/penicillin-binding protein 2
MAGESAGILRHYTKWWGSQDMSRIGMGYSISVTPLQMLTAMCAVANGGELVRPRIIDSISDHSGHIVSEGQRHVVRRVIKERTAKDVCLALAKVVGPKGTAPKAAVEGYAVAGKTGTAQMLMPSGQYSSKHLVTSFAGFLPAEDPKFACIVVLHDPQFPGMKMGGGSVAAPIFADIARQCMPVLGVEPAFIPTSTSDTDTETASNSVLR